MAFSDDGKIVKKAKVLFKKQKFRRAIDLLESGNLPARLKKDYDDNKSDCDPLITMDCFYILGVSCMYTNEIYSAKNYLLFARQISRDNSLLVCDVHLAEAALFLRDGNTPKALEIYSDVARMQPNNKTAKKALHFLRTTKFLDKVILEQKSNGKIKRFYPPTGVYVPILPLFVGFLGILAALCIFLIVKSILPSAVGERADLAKLGIVLTEEDKKSRVSTDIATQTYRYILTEDEVDKLFLYAQDDFQRHKDNAARTKINKLLLSNASPAVKNKSQLLADQLEEPIFEELREADDNYSIAAVMKEPLLFNGCYVVWSGRAANVERTEAGIVCDFLAGYADLKKIDGKFRLKFSHMATFDEGEPFEVMAKLCITDTESYLEGRTIFQPRN